MLSRKHSSIDSCIENITKVLEFELHTRHFSIVYSLSITILALIHTDIYVFLFLLNSFCFY